MFAVLYSLLSALSLVHSSPSEIIDGYSNKLSAFPGDSIELYLNARTDISAYKVKLFDLSGNEMFAFKTAIKQQLIENKNPFADGYGYRLTKKVRVPDLASGVYMWENQIPFIIKSRHAKITVVYPSNTNNAYCNSGGKSLYGFNSTENIGAQKVSFLRPMSLPKYAEAFLRWLPKQQVPDVGYITDADLDEYSNFQKSKLIIVAGHSEYWTLPARKNFDRFVNEGKNAMILSGNTMWWQVRYNSTKDQLICYRNIKDDPARSPKLKTINWSDPSLSYPIYTSTGTDFQNAGYGLKNDNGWDGYHIVNSSPLLAGTTLKPGDKLPLPSDETDGAPLLVLENGIPIPDRQKLNFEKIEVIGYDLVSRAGKEGVATWIVFKASPSSGVVINTASTDWCGDRGIGSSRDIQKITLTMIAKLRNGEQVFSESEQIDIN